MHVRKMRLATFELDSLRRFVLVQPPILAPNRRRTVRRAASWLAPIAIAIGALTFAAPWLSAQALPPPKPNQVATFSFHPSSSGTITVTLPQIIRQRATIIVGVTFSPADITGVAIGEVGGGAGDVESLNRGLATSILHNGPGGPFYTNFYYGPNHGNQLAGLGAGTVTLNFSGGATFALIAVAEVSGLACLDCQELDQSAYNESLSPASSWSSGSATTTAFNEYLFSWGATEASDSNCSSPGNGWTLESQTNDPSGAAVCLLDQFVAAPGLSYAASVKASPAANYGMEIVTFAKQIPSFGQPAVTSVNPSFGAQGQSLPTVVIAGSGFDSNVVCSFGAGITVNSCTPNSATQMVANVTIAPTAAVGPRNVTVTSTTESNSGGTLANAFSVTPGAAVGGIGGSVSPTSATIAVGSSANFVVNLTSTGGFTGQVSLACSGASSGLGCTFNPRAVNLPANRTASSILTVQVSAKPSILTTQLPAANRPLFPARDLRLVGLGQMGLGLVLLAALLSFGFVLRPRFVASEESLFGLNGIACPSRSCVAGLASFALVLVLAVGLISCGGTTSKIANTSGGGTNTTTGATGSTGGTGGMGGTGGTGGGGGTGGSSGGSSVTTQVTVQAQSAGATANLGTISITVP